jgi:crossover junction endodeoxyribonuclease RuvC
MAKIIGIDPGLAATGIGVVTGVNTRIHAFSYGGIYTPSKTPSGERLNLIYSRLVQVIENEKPDLMVIEDAFSLEKYPKSGINLGKVMGVILLAGFRAGLPVMEISVREAKQIITGNGKATKIQLESAVRNLLNQATAIRPFHASDALGLALVGLYRYKGRK